VRRHLEESGQREKARVLQNQLERSRDLLRQQFAYLLAFTPHQLHGQTLETLNAHYQTRLIDGCYLCLAVRIDGSDIDVDDNHIHSVADKLPALFERTLAGKCADVLAFRDGAVVIVNTPSDESWRRIPKIIYDETQKLLSAYAYLHGTVGIGTPETAVHHIARSVETALKAQTARLTLGIDRTIDGATLHFAAVQVRDVISQSSEAHLIHLIEAFDIPAIADWIRAVYARVLALKDAPPDLPLEVGREIAAVFARTVNQLGLDSGAALVTDLMRRLNKITVADAIPREVERFVLTRLDAFLEAKRFQDSRPIRLAKQYINDHFHESITLEDIAGVVHLNAVYFSVIFKREVGINFSDYLIQMRIEAAKALLKESHMTINEIAERVGYRDSRYFSKLFRKIVGVYPNEYRKLYS